jgi:preprotein translocase subunit SecG
MNILLGFLIVLLVLVALLLLLLILMQRPRQEGLGASFGGNITESVFGAQASNVLEKGTVWLTVLFFVLTITIAAIYSRQTGAHSLQQKLRMEPITATEPPSTTPPDAGNAAESAENAPTPQVSEAPEAPAQP